MSVIRVKRHFIQIKPSKSKATILSGNPEGFSDTRVRKINKMGCQPTDRGDDSREKPGGH